jgi:hypothetical protein
VFTQQIVKTKTAALAKNLEVADLGNEDSE